MSEPKRYIFRIRECGCVKPEHLEGKYAPPALIIEETKENYGWVKWDDYARLKAEVERLTLASQGAVKYVDHTMALTRQSMEHHKQVSRLEALVERLTKAGDYLDRDVKLLSKDLLGKGAVTRHSQMEWHAAKEGKQP